MSSSQATPHLPPASEELGAVLGALDPRLAPRADALLREMTALREQSAPAAPGADPRAAVADALYARGLEHASAGPELAPLAERWSPPPRERWSAPLLTEDDLISPARLEDRYDAVVIGSGAGGGVAAMTLARSGRRVLILERGALPAREQLIDDHLRTPRSASRLLPRSGPEDGAEPRLVQIGETLHEVSAADPMWGNNAMTVGGGTRVYGAQAWRFAPRDFAMASIYGVPEGSALADWPIGYEDLEPFYTRIEQMLGVSGGPFTDPWDGERAAPLPMGPLPMTALAGRLAAGARALGLGTQPVPLLISSAAFGGRAGCIGCSQCVGFDCPVGAKAGSHSTTLPAALATGAASLLTSATATRILVGRGGRAEGVRIQGTDPRAPWERTVRAEMVVLAAGAIESARLLLASATDDHPAGLGNDADMVGRHLQGHAYGGASALFEDRVVDLRGPGPRISTADLRHGTTGIIGGGILADEFVPTPAATVRYLVDAGLVGPEVRVGSPEMERAMLRLGRVVGPIQEVTTAQSRVRADPRRRDRLGRPLVHLSGSLHPEDLRGRDMLSARAAEWLEASGARTVRTMPPIQHPTPPNGGQHQAGTCRMGTDPARSVTDPLGRVWDHPNVLVADASTHVTNGGANPVLTVLANSLRITEAACS